MRRSTRPSAPSRSTPVVPGRGRRQAPGWRGFGGACRQRPPTARSAAPAGRRRCAISRVRGPLAGPHSCRSSPPSGLTSALGVAHRGCVNQAQAARRACGVEAVAAGAARRQVSATPVGREGQGAALAHGYSSSQVAAAGPHVHPFTRTPTSQPGTYRRALMSSSGHAVPTKPAGRSSRAPHAWIRCRLRPPRSSTAQAQGMRWRRLGR